MRKMLNALVLLALLASVFNAPLASHAQGIGDTPTPAESTETPTVEATAVATDTPTEETRTPEATGTPTATGPEATATENITPTGEATETATGTATATQRAITLSLTPTPQFVTPGGMATLHWTITGIDLAAHTLALQAVLPDGVSPKAGEGTFDSGTRTLTLAAAAATGQFHLSVQAVAAPITIVVTLVEASQTLATATITILTQEEFVVQSSGGQISAMGGKIKINIPAGALSEQTRISVGQPDKAEAPRGSLSGHAFAIRAYGMETETVLHQFGKRIEIEAHYADFGIEPGHEQELYVWWYNPETGGWAALQSEADAKTGIIKGHTDHFTLFDIGVENWQAHMMPSVDAFQVASFTGAATYSLPIQVPEGPGGLKPDLTLSYNSQVVDQSTTETQSGWAGMGWTLDTGSIVADDHGDDDWANDSWLLSMGGFTTRVVKLTTGEYRMLDERFWKISYNLSSDYWTVTDKNGNDYFFEERSQRGITTHCAAQRDDHEPAFSYRTYKWSLTRVRNIFNQQLTYAYTHETKNIPHDTWIGGTGNCITTSDPADTAVYPSTINYPGDRVRVRFELQSRLDYPSDWRTDAANHAFQRQRLKRVFVEEDPDGEGPLDFVIMRKYVLTYAANGAEDVVFPGHVFTAGGETSTLISVQMFGTGATDSLPATVFEYDAVYGDRDPVTNELIREAVHLLRAKNGYGGTVTFSYETTPWKATSTSADYKKTDNGGTLFDAYGAWSIRNGATLQPSSKLNVYNRTLTNTEYDKEMVRPGGAYYLKATKESTQAHVRVGLDTGDTILWACGTDEDCPTATLYLPANAEMAAPVIRGVIPGTTNPVYVTEFQYELRPTFNRVQTKVLADGQSGSYSWTYSYTGPAMNDVSNTVPCASPCVRYFPRQTEFRGHSTVTETGPDGRVTITTFSQGSTDPAEGDALKGRPLTVTVKDGITQLTKTLYTYDVTAYADTFAQPTGFGDVQRTWAHTKAEENRIYTTIGSDFAATKTSYTYAAQYGNVTLETQKRCSAGCNDSQTQTWATYRSKATDYFPNASAYLVGFPARITMQDAGGNRAAQTLYLYDTASTYNTQPTVGKLKVVRTLVDTQGGLDRFSQVSYGYDAWGNRTAVTTYSGYGAANSAPDATGAHGTYTCYGGGGQVGGITCDDDGYHFYPLWIKNPIGTTNVSYDYQTGVPLSETDPNGVTVTATYDAFGRMLTLTRPPDTSFALSMSYNDTNQASVNSFVTTITQHVDNDAYNQPIYYSAVRTYDGLGRQRKVEAEGITTDYGYDAYGRIVSQSTPYQTGETAYATVTDYDVLGRPRFVTLPDGSQTGYTYTGLSTQITDANNHETTTTNDVWGRVISVDAPTGPDVTYEYDVLDHLKSATRGGASSLMEYDAAGRKISMTDPDMGSWAYGYDAEGNLTSQTDARGCTLTMTYDALSRMTSKSGSDITCGAPVSVTYGYDDTNNGGAAIGRRTSMTSGSVSNAWTYDARGRVTSSTASGYTTGWTYNSADMPKTMTYPGSESVTYGYNDRKLLETLGSYVTSSAYDSAGRLTSRAFGNSVDQAFTYYGWAETITDMGNEIGQSGRLKNILSGTLQDLNYKYDAVGNVKEIRDDIASETNAYDYDALDRLTSWALNGGTPEVYDYYAATGNLWHKGTQALEYNDSSHAHAVTDAGTNEYSYDANGNMTTRVIGQDTYALSYDAENRLVEVKKNDVTIASFVYDGDGNRVQSTINGVTTTFVGNYYEVTGSTVTKYYYAGGSRVAMSIGSTVSYLLTDQLGSTSLMTDASGNKVSELRYDAWGQVRYSSGTTPTKYTFTGQYSNVADFGLMFYNARWYDGALGRFTSADTIVPPGVQGWDRYAYGLNNPSRYTDPTGHWVLESNDPEDEVRFKAFYHAYERVNDKDSSLAAHKKEYYLTAAAYYWARMEDNEIDIQIGADLLQSRADAVRINGWNSVDDAQSAAGDVGLIGAPEFVAQTGAALAGGLWTFGSHHSMTKWTNQMETRGWTTEQITEAIKSGEAIPAENKVHPGNGATRYVSPTTGRSVVVDDVTHEILHLGGDDFVGY